ncbi:hypothetical protein [Nonomuraea angiospora]|uniref:hypothetical protein n=1 Tax=Nonomuraea angiospora TaxID=46172 RepID=UPI0029A63EC6|nr:hypothetical protein [Nonomuraea angiospora]MDX3110750.1 hypothetical protein [Nonomuraea angiospora]
MTRPTAAAGAESRAATSTAAAGTESRHVRDAEGLTVSTAVVGAEGLTVSTAVVGAEGHADFGGPPHEHLGGGQPVAGTRAAGADRVDHPVHGRRLRAVARGPGSRRPSKTER